MTATFAIAGSLRVQNAPGRHYPHSKACAACRSLLATDPRLNSPRLASARMRSAVRHAMAWIVSDGLAPPTVGNTEPSQIQRLGMSQLRQSASTTLLDGPLPIRA